jgi:hypothetical protein
LDFLGEQIGLEELYPANEDGRQDRQRPGEFDQGAAAPGFHRTTSARQAPLSALAR